eukprot:6491989-Amphidinium_carterae.1
MTNHVLHCSYNKAHPVIAARVVRRLRTDLLPSVASATAARSARQIWLVAELWKPYDIALLYRGNGVFVWTEVRWL